MGVAAGDVAECASLFRPTWPCVVGGRRFGGAMCNEYLRRRGVQDYAREFSQIKIPAGVPAAAPVCLGGIWDRCETTDAGTVESFTILMRDPAPPLDQLHNRQPVILRHRDWATWLDLKADVTPMYGLENGDRFSIERV